MIQDVVYRCTTDNLKYDGGRHYDKEAATHCIEDSTKLTEQEKAIALRSLKHIVNYGTGFSVIDNAIETIIRNYIAR